MREIAHCGGFKFRVNRPAGCNVFEQRYECYAITNGEFQCSFEKLIDEKLDIKPKVVSRFNSLRYLHREA